MAVNLATLAASLPSSVPAAAPRTPAPLAQVPMLEAPASGAALSGEGAEPSAFQSVLAEAVGRVQSYQAASQDTIAQFLNGADVDLHQVALGVQKAETTFELFSEVRNKVVQAYQEIMRSQV